MKTRKNLLSGDISSGKNFISYFLLVIIVILLVLLFLVRRNSVLSGYQNVRVGGFLENYNTILNRNPKNLVFYTFSSTGSCAAQEVGVSPFSYSSGETPISVIDSSIGSSYFKINIPPLSVSNVADVMVNETGFFRNRNINEPLITSDMVETAPFLCYWIAGREQYGLSFNPDTYTIENVHGYTNQTTFSENMPPAVEFMYYEGVCSGLCVRNIWHGYVIDIEYGTSYEGVSSYDLTVQGPTRIPLTYYESYIYKHDNPSDDDPHFHLAPRLKNSRTQKLNPTVETNYNPWQIKISRTTTVMTASEASSAGACSSPLFATVSAGANYRSSDATQSEKNKKLGKHGKRIPPPPKDNNESDPEPTSPVPEDESGEAAGGAEATQASTDAAAEAATGEVAEAATGAIAGEAAGDAALGLLAFCTIS